MWDIPGGTAGENETPEECITREIEEELGLVLTGPVLFEKREFQDRVEFTFWQRADFDVEHIRLTEGQRLAWFSEKEAKRTHLAFDFNITIDSFFTKAPFRKQLT
jgi:8-oxo-dGTP diphosphatase